MLGLGMPKLFRRRPRAYGEFETRIRHETGVTLGAKILGFMAVGAIVGFAGIPFISKPSPGTCPSEYTLQRTSWGDRSDQNRNRYICSQTANGVTIFRDDAIPAEGER